MTGREVVQARNLLAGTQQGLEKMRSDETGTAREQPATRPCALWRVNPDERRATIWMRSVSRLGDDARDLIVAGAAYTGG